MVNLIAPFGFREWRRLDGSAPTGGMETLTIAASDTNLYFTGDPVATNATGPYVTAPSGGNVQIRGVFKGCEYYSAVVGKKVWTPFFPGAVGTTATTGDAQAWVITDPDMLWLVQTSTGQGAPTVVGSSQMGMNFGFSSGTSSQGNQLTGVSAVTLNSTSYGTTNTLPFRLADMYSNWAPPGVNGTDNTNLGNMVIVAPNNWDRKQLTGV